MQTKDTSFLNYAEVNSTLQKQSTARSNLFVLDDNTEYAQLVHGANEDKASTLQTVEKGIVCTPWHAWAVPKSLLMAWNVVLQGMGNLPDTLF